MVWEGTVLHQNFLHLGPNFLPGQSFRPSPSQDQHIHLQDGAEPHAYDQDSVVRQDEDKNCGSVQVASSSHLVKPKLVSWRYLLEEKNYKEDVQIEYFQTASSTKSSEEESTPKLVGQRYANLSMVEPYKVYAAFEDFNWGVVLHKGLSNILLECLYWMCDGSFSWPWSSNWRKTLSISAFSIGIKQLVISSHAQAF